jgi:hypothetical protein
VSAQDVRLRWIAFVSSELDADSARVEEALGLARCFDEPYMEEFGIASRVYPLGPDRFLEIFSPVADGAPKRHIARRGPGVYMLTFQVPDLVPHTERLRRAGIRVVAEMKREFTTGKWASIQLHPADVGGTLTSLDWCAPPEEFPALEADWRRFTRRQVVDDVVSVDIGGPDPESLAERWGVALGGRPDGLELRTADTVMRFDRASGPERIVRVTLRAADPSLRGAVVSLGSSEIELI